jgi:outer membrane protein OmpA-like peptidoglycan-associated protein
MLRHAAVPGFALALIAVPAAGQMDFSGQGGNFYIQGFGGANWVDDMNLTASSGVAPANATLSFDTGYGIGGAVGYDWGQFRVEGEIAYRDNDLDGATGSPLATFPPTSGDVSAFTIMANAYLDVENDSALTPYLGAGIGAGQVDLTYSSGGTTLIDDDGWGFAAQGIAGVSYAVSDQVDVFAEGRVLSIFDTSLSGSSGQLDITSATVDDDYLSYGAFAGLRINFGAPAPMAEPQPAPAPEPEPVAVQTEFMVFFDWDESVLTPQANNTLDQVVVVYDENGFAQVNLAGHTDTSGPTDYNQRLGLRRAESVRQGLVARGVAPDEIVVRSFGETDLLVPTPDGVREPQNRRVEIVMM